jgi:hypothetical protein
MMSDSDGYESSRSVALSDDTGGYISGAEEQKKRSHLVSILDKDLLEQVQVVLPPFSCSYSFCFQFRDQRTHLRVWWCGVSTQNEALQAVINILGCSVSAARTLLIYFRWDTEGLFGTHSVLDVLPFCLL